MNQHIVLAVGITVLLIGGILYWATREAEVNTTPEGSTPTAVVPAPAINVYQNTTLGYTLTLPTALSATSSEVLFSVDEDYTYTLNPDTTIAGVQFRIPRGLTTTTNLSNDTYLSVEELEAGAICAAESFIERDDVATTTITDAGITYSFASTTEGAAGSRFEEYVYVLPNTTPCLAVRYFIHETVLENYPTGTVTAYDKAALQNTFDAIRRSLTFSE